MFGILGNLTKAAVGVVTLPIKVVADVATLGGAVTDRQRTYTGEAVSQVLKNIDKATK